jgi:uncharacterized protein (DUF2252 family)
VFNVSIAAGRTSERRLPHPTVAERAAAGKAARRTTPRSSHSQLTPPAGRDPVARLDAEAASRVDDLVPIRYGRMIASPFAFYRGAAAVMAEDLASTPRVGLDAQLCGDAHLMNFGGFASPERQLVFDVNDFDQTCPGPFEWDVKRLAASVEVLARDGGLGAEARRGAVLGAVGAYRRAMGGFADLTNLNMWYASLDVHSLIAELRRRRDETGARGVKRLARHAHTRDSAMALARLTHAEEGEPRITSDPPLVVPIAELVDGGVAAEALEAKLRSMFRSYRSSLPPERRVLLESFRYGDLARKVVGIGSVGTNCWILLLLGRDSGDPLFLQLKEAEPSVLEPILGRVSFASSGERVVEGQRLMQAASDIFLGWGHGDDIDGGARDFYVRQLWDWKISPSLEALSNGRVLTEYAAACGWTLARAHARSGDRVAIAAYLGGSDVFDSAIAEFATAYADVTAADHATLVAAVNEGRLEARVGV